MNMLILIVLYIKSGAIVLGLPFWFWLFSFFNLVNHVIIARSKEDEFLSKKIICILPLLRLEI